MSTAEQKQDNSRTAVFEKLPPELRRAVNVAIIEQAPPNFRALWMQFELGKYGVRYHSLYRYARRLRDRVNLAEAAALATEDDADIDGAIQKLASRRLLELLLNTDGADLNWEVSALPAAHQQRERIALSSRRLEEHARLARARLEHDREQLRLKSELLRSARDGVLTLLDEAKKRRRPVLDEKTADPLPSPAGVGK